MDPSETNKFENQWKRAFDDASETPPPNVWEGIEAHLDRDDNNKVVPLWWRSPKIWYAAASIVALLLVGRGIWYSGKSSFSNGKNGTEIASENSSENTGGNKENEAINTTESAADNEKPLIAGNAKPGIAKQSLESSGETSISKKVSSEASAVASAKEDYAKLTGRKKGSAVDVERVKKTTASDRSIPNNEDPFSLRPGSKEGFEVARRRVSEDHNSASGVSGKNSLPAESTVSKVENVGQTNQAAELSALIAIPYNDLDVYLQKRYVFFKQDAIAEEKLPPIKKSKEYWAGIDLMPASFNPDIKIKESPKAFASQLSSRQKSLTGTNQAGTSYAVQTHGAVRFSKHWTAELGLSYLQGNATYQGGGYVVNSYNNTSSNVLQDALSGLASADKNLAATPGFTTNNNTLYIDVDKKVSNDYQFIQVPLQAGFTLNPDKKLSYSVLGGMMANFFLKNELESASGEIITTTASDDVYKSMNWAATTGLRFNYKLSTKWRASLTGSYQKAITSGIRANQSLESHPFLYGVSWGVRYSF